MTDGLNMSRRLRRTAYTKNVEAAGVSGYSIVNHMLLPKGFQKTVEEDYWHLREQVQVWTSRRYIKFLTMIPNYIPKLFSKMIPKTMQH